MDPNPKNSAAIRDEVLQLRSEITARGWELKHVAWRQREEFSLGAEQRTSNKRGKSRKKKVIWCSSLHDADAGEQQLLFETKEDAAVEPTTPKSKKAGKKGKKKDDEEPDGGAANEQRAQEKQEKNKERRSKRRWKRRRRKKKKRKAWDRRSRTAMTKSYKKLW